MKKYFCLINSILALYLVSLLLQGCSSNNSIINVTSDKAEDLIKANIGNPHFIILDVRTPEEFNSEHFTNAVNIDFKSQDFPDNIDKLNKEETYMVYCRGGVRSSKAAGLMKEKGFKSVYNLEGGLLKWHSENRSLDIKNN
jgi:rhodanese-related sulfurtransferase